MTALSYEELAAWAERKRVRGHLTDGLMPANAHAPARTASRRKPWPTTFMSWRGQPDDADHGGGAGDGRGDRLLL
jgi:hypothetical protein